MNPIPIDSALDPMTAMMIGITIHSPFILSLFSIGECSSSELINGIRIHCGFIA